MTDQHSLIPSEQIERTIVVIRGHKVMLDSDLAELYQVEAKALNRAVKRNLKRFPLDFMFQLTSKEHDSLRCQFGTLKQGRGQHRKYLPYVFTEHGVAMLSSVLNSERAILVNVEIMRAFGRLRQILTSHGELTLRLDELEQRYDVQFAVVFEAMRELMGSPDSHGRQIGFNMRI